MRKVIVFIVVLFALVACNLDKLEPAQTKAFMKLFGDVGNTEGVDLLKLADGYLLLGNNINGNKETAVLIKTDLNGNQVWSSSFENISGSALAKNDNSYFIVGDSINLSSPLSTRMSLIKTNPDGELLSSTSLGEVQIPYHGTGVTVSNTGQTVVVCGYTRDIVSNNDSTFIYGYNTSLSPAWSGIQKNGSTGDIRVSSKTLIQDINNNFIYTTMYGDGSAVQAIVTIEDNPNLPATIDLLAEDISTGDLGDFSSYSPDGGVMVQTVKTIDNETGIAMAIYDSFTLVKTALISQSKINFTAGTVIQASDGDIVILGSVNKRTNDPENETRSDLDFYITKVGDNGSVSSISGFTNIIGGTGDETGAALVQADDRGFVFLGTMKNTNEVNIMVLVKVDVNGELIN